MLQVEAVSKSYAPVWRPLRPLVRTASAGPVEALRSVSFGVASGEMVGLVGPNGAGKTTLLRIVATLLTPTRGTVSVGGYDVVRAPAEVRRRVGLVLEGDRGLYERLNGRENLEFFGALAGLSPAAARSRAEELLVQSGLTGADKLVFGYSSGMRARLSLARALLGDPGLLLLDEPTRSLDPLASEKVLGQLSGLARQGKAVLLSSHRVGEVVSCCTRVVVLGGGEVRYDGPVAALRGPGPAAALSGVLEGSAANPTSVADGRQ
jgi:ABC-2 type transport system ATP-binding protein